MKKRELIFSDQYTTTNGREISTSELTYFNANSGLRSRNQKENINVMDLFHEYSNITNSNLLLSLEKKEVQSLHPAGLSTSKEI